MGKMVFVHSVDFQRFSRKPTSKRDTIGVSKTRQETTRRTFREPESHFFPCCAVHMEKQSLEEQLLHPLEQKRDQNAGTRKNKQINPFTRTNILSLTD